MKPFQVNDSILLDNNEYVVKQMGLFTTWVRDANGMMHIWSNEILTTKLDGLVNLSQTDLNHAKFTLSFYVDNDITSSKLKQFRNDFQDDINLNMHPKCGNVNLKIGEFDTNMKCKVQLSIVSFVPFGDKNLRQETQRDLYYLMKDRLEKNDIKMENVC